MTNRLNRIKSNFDFILKDFSPDKEPKQVWENYNDSCKTLKEKVITIPDHQHIYDPYIVFIIFVYLKSYEFSGTFEKVAWSIPINYKNIPFILTHRKFGFQIRSNSSENNIDSIGVEAIEQINKAIPLAEILFEPNIKDLVSHGKVTLENQKHAIYNRYMFFRKKAISEFKKAEKNKGNFKTKTTEFKGKNVDSVTTITDVSHRYELNGSNYAIAMLDAFYCFLEHIFVLLLPFNLKDQQDLIDLESFISLNWRDKFKNIISLDRNKIAQNLFEKILQIKEDFRNPLSHGYFLKEGFSFYVHVRHLGAIPMSLKHSDNHMKYAFSPIIQFTFQETCSAFDDLIDFLKLYDKTKYGMMYIETGLPVAFDENSRKEYQEAMKDENEFTKFIHYKATEYERALNMDW